MKERFQNILNAGKKWRGIIALCTVMALVGIFDVFVAFGSGSVAVVIDNNQALKPGTIYSHNSSGEQVVSHDAGNSYSLDEGGNVIISYNNGETKVKAPLILHSNNRDYAGEADPGVYISGEKTAIAYGGRYEEPVHVLISDDMGKTWTYDEKYNLALIWADAWKTRNGKPRYEIMSSQMQAEFLAQQEEMSGDPDNFVIRWSSPWVERYDVAIDGEQAVITYWYTDSTGSGYKGLERLTFEEENGRTVVTECKTEIEMDELSITVTNVKDFADLVVKYLEVGNKEGLASSIKYPITVTIDGQLAVIYKAEEFIMAYDKIVNDAFRTAVLATDTQELFMNHYGAMLGNGEIWLDQFDNAGYKIYAINNSTETSYREKDTFKTSWANKTQHTGMSINEMNACYAKLLKDVPHTEECYEIWGIAYEDMDLNGTKDLILQLKLASGSITPDSYPGAYLCIYMNDDPVYLQAYDSSLYLGFSQVLHADADHDGYQEIIYSIFTGGNGGAGSTEKAMLKYKNHTLEQMQFPGEVSEQFSDGRDVGYEVKVLFGNEENEYKAVCDSLYKTILFQAENAVDENGKRMTPYLREDEQAGANCRGYAVFSIINRNGREYLQAKEYLHGEGGTSHCVGWATFLMDWDSDGNPFVFEFGVES